ncbi:MAG: pantetheine-phosphate adenylyltransferase [Oceanotoga sp.]|uniref:pantetheine-phosphate adenylyltransferase n=1 Tax=Oceanotoga sp. TaxID=2108366 RepID=UPI002656DEA4|nr:pantetheine-phosphate adenylyltransferase [Oceanotoga sp.]MDN5342389.1 pantetheine-phosphate adenylyltransferase [Oceanotoga sp.]
MQKRIAVYPGSFDPITYGHINLVKRAAERFEKLNVVIMNNSEKRCLFTLEERVEMTKANLSHIPNVEIDTFSGLLVQYCKLKDISTVIRGLRAVTDFEYELQMANGNRSLMPQLEIFFLMSDVAHSFISSSMVKEVARYDGDVSTWVSPLVEKKLKEKFRKN